MLPDNSWDLYLPVVVIHWHDFIFMKWKHLLTDILVARCGKPEKQRSSFCLQPIWKAVKSYTATASVT